MDANVTSIDGGGQRSNIVYTKTDGSLWCLGSNEHMESFNGTYINSNDPIQVVDSNVVSAASGGSHTLFAKADGSLWAMGSNSFGQFGTGTSSDLTRPVQVLPDSVSTANPSGFGHILKNDGSLLHHGNAAALYLPVNQPTPTQYLNHDIVQAANPYNQTVYLKADGSGRLVGHGRTDEQIVPGGVAIVAGPNGSGGHSLFIKENGSLWGFGDNTYGQLGDGTTTDRDDPFQIVASEMVAAAASGYHSLFIQTDGSLWAMGRNQYGQLGDGTTEDRHAPVKVVNDGVIAVVAGSGHTLFLKEDGSLWAMGRNHHGQLGDGTTQTQHSPVKVVDAGVIAMAAGYGSSGQVESLMVKADGSLWSVGSNEYGQLGDGTLENRATWTKVLDSGVRGVSASGNSVFVFADPNQAPTDLYLSNHTILENQPIGTMVGELNATDPDSWLNTQSFSYAFADGNGSEQNSLFSLDVNGSLRTAAILDHEVHPNLSIRVKVTDDHNASMEKMISISVSNQNEAPSDLYVTAPLQVLENQPAGTFVGQFTAHDPDHPSTLSYRIDNAYVDKYSLRLDTNGTLWTKAPLDFEANATLTIRVKVWDQHGAWIKKFFTIEVLNEVEDFDGDGIEDAYDPDDDNDGYSDTAEIAYGSDPRDANSVADTLPTDITLSHLEILENQPIGTIVGQFTVVDPDPKDTHVVRFNDLNANDSHNHLFTIDSNNTLRTAVIFDFENNDTALMLRVKAKQNQVGVFWKFFTLSVLNDPTDDDSPPTNEDQNQTTVEPVTPKYVPIVRTQEVVINDKGAYVFRGRILTDGGADILQAGIEISRSLGFRESQLHLAEPRWR